MSTKSSLRQRKGSKGKPKATTEPPKKGKAVTIQVEEPETLLQTFFRHPLVRVIPIVFLTYIVYTIYNVLTLRHPEWITAASLGLVSLRPSVAPDGLRQVLIVGPEIQENYLISKNLASSLGFEITHEKVDAYNYYCRDGTVSWFQIMRFMEPVLQAVKKEKTLGAWKELCLDRNHSMIEVFHPKDYGSSQCSTYEKWSNCWSQKCLNIVKSVWGCETDTTRPCPQQFSRILHQVRHPMATIATLNFTVCPHPKLKKAFTDVVAGFFPDRQWQEMSCLEAMGWYTIDFHQKLIKARDVGYIHGMFQAETVSPCEVASMSGLAEEVSAVYQPNVEKFNRACREDDDNKGNLDALAQDLFVKVKKKNKGDVIRGVTPVTLQDISDSRLSNEIRNLVAALGYETEEGAEFV